MKKMMVMSRLLDWIDPGVSRIGDEWICHLQYQCLKLWPKHTQVSPSCLLVRIAIYIFSQILSCLWLWLTLLILDIAGFTSWSSNRQPEDVFRLLETYFAAFDALAAKYDVFKVETIGETIQILVIVSVVSFFFVNLS